ncbi:MAG TPA: DUF2905 domain-containing protein [Gemmatimonadales bacterium]|jgi:hypothetical protein|nr:DUF2905 domain-containing protein [Gemmatimonadales bacterium]
MDERGLGLVLGGIGLGLLLLGILLWSGGLGWFGRLPGDIRIERDGVRVYVPIVSMLVVSAALSLLLWLIRRLS